jgi:thioredoxin 1
MNIKNATDADFDTTIASGLVLVDFWAEWCGPCWRLAPVLEAVAQAHPDLQVVKLNIELNIGTTSRFNVRSIPLLLFFKDGQVVDQIIGAVPQPVVEAKIMQHS